MGQSAAEIVLSSVSAGVGSVAQADLATGLELSAVAALLSWLVWAWLTWDTR